MAAIVSVMVVVAVLFAVSAVVVPTVPVAVGINDPRRCRSHHYYWRRRGSMIVPVTMPVTIVITRLVGTIGAGRNRNGCDQGDHDRQQDTVLFHGSSSFCTDARTNWIVG